MRFIMKFRITNQYNTLIWEGEASSYYDAWQKMFDDCNYPPSPYLKSDPDPRSISGQIDAGMWIEKVA